MSLEERERKKSSKRYNQHSINMQVFMRIMHSDSKCSLAVGFLFSSSSNWLTQSTFNKDFWVSVIQECESNGGVRVYFCTKWLHEKSHPKSGQRSYDSNHTESLDTKDATEDIQKGASPLTFPATASSRWGFPEAEAAFGQLWSTDTSLNLSVLFLNTTQILDFSLSSHKMI